MKLIDLHCDTAFRFFEDREREGLYRNNYHVDIQKLKQSHSAAQFFALFVNRNKCIKEDLPVWDAFLQKHRLLMKQLELCGEDIALAENADDLDENLKRGKISAFLTIEEGGILEGQLTRLEKAYEMGVRLITLTWNYPNSLGFPNSLCESDYPNQRLTEFGVQVVEYMNEKGMIVDVSHLSDQGFYHVHEISRKPYIASHSNARALKAHGRNLTDDMLRTLANDGGITGINFYPPFLNDLHASTAESMVEHIRHIENVAGIESIAIGTDFDGIDGYLEISDIGKMELLLHALKKAGYGDDKIDKIWFKNAYRVIREVMK